MRTYLLAPKHNVGRMACLTASVAVLLLCALPQLAGAAGLSSSPDSGPAVHHDTSPPLLSLRPSGTPGQAYPARPTPPLPSASSRTSARDTSGSQAASPFNAPLASPLMPSTSANFNGIPENACGCVPPDPSGAAGPSQYVEVANTDLAVYSKTGTALLGPEATNTLWSGFGGGCEKNNDGDGTVLFDTMSQRWVVQQFSVSTTPYLDCVAVSKTSDATGEWYRYSFQYEKFPDYPKMGVWPDAYYASFNLFTSGFVGAEACAFNRAAMLKGEAASQQCFVGTEKGGSSLLPATLDGTTQPPSGESEWFVALSPTEKNALAYWKFHVDWSNPANTTFTGPTNLPVEAFSEACGGGACVPQSETTQQLDSLGDRLMFRLAYRNFGAHESMVVSHAVTAGSSVGMRWYELRPSNGSLTVYQQGTYAPDSTYRWMGSIAMDKSGDMALGYSASSSSLHPQIRYTGRLVGDPLGTIPQGEATLYEGAGSQTSYVRWGDYTEMSVDPSDECTFWYVNEYLPSNGSFNWRTRIGSFKFPSCGGPTAITEPATSITETEATLNGTVNPNGSETKYYFEYGTSISYGTKTPEASAGSGTSNVKVSQKITGLTAGTTYHFRIVATDSNGTTDGIDRTFRTQAEAAAPGSNPTAVRDASSGNQWVYYVGKDEAIWVLFWNGSAWTETRLGGKAAAKTSPTAVLASNGEQWVYYQGSNGSIDLWTWNGKEWAFGERSGHAAAASTSPTVVRNSASGEQWVYYQGSNGNVDLWTWTGTEWAFGERSGHVAAAKTSPTAVLASNGEQWVYYQGSNGSIDLWTWNGKEWAFGERSGHAAAASTSPTVVRNSASGEQWVYYQGSNGNVDLWTWTGTEWAFGELSGHAAAAASTSPTVVRNSANGEQWVYYQGSNGSIDLWTWNGKEWAFGERSGHAAAASTSPMVVRASNGEQWVYYQNSENAIWQFYWNGSSWINSSL